MRIKLFQPNNQPVKPVSVPPTRFDRVLDLVALFLIVLLWVLAISFFIDDAPDKIPTGFDAAGNPRGWGSAAFYFLMPVIATPVVGLMFLSTRYPQLINLPVALRQQVIVHQSALMIRCCRWLNIVCEVMMLFILIFMAGFQYETLYMDSDIFVAGIYGTVILMFVVIIYYSVRISRVK
ncbi:MAG: DUF1648 domain-containing protein [Bacteroidaceae bacterium]|nr:DUF1648 domain-containing protein [Bacteroidaceae bacterium]